MRAKLNNYSWLPFAFLGVSVLFFVSCLWNFCHAYIMAGGENPLVLLEGRVPAWSGTAIAIGLASIGSDIVKAVGAFILMAALTNGTLSKTAKTGAIVLALILCVPTILWSARSATGMAAMAFGDAIANRGNEAVGVASLRAQINADQKRLDWLARQTSSVARVRTANMQEATELRNALRENRLQLRASPGVGYADPGAGVIANITGASEEHITNLTIALFVFMVEIGSTLGFPAIAFATRLGAAPANQRSEDDAQRDDKDRGSKEDAEPIEEHDQRDEEDDVAPKNDDDNLRPVAAADKASEPSRTAGATAKLIPFKGRDMRLHARMDDGHVEEFVKMLSASNVDGDSLPFRSTVWESYKRFCADKSLRHMNDKALSNALARFGISRHRPTGGVVYVRLPADIGDKIGIARRFFGGNVAAV